MPVRMFLLLIVALLQGCTTLERGLHLYSSDASAASTFTFKDGGQAVFYTFTSGNPGLTDTAVFFYGGTGCASWKAVMPGYVQGLDVNARVFVLNKRFVADRSTGLFDCGRAFNEVNSPEQWLADSTEFIASRLAEAKGSFRHVVLVGVSEGAIPAIQAAAALPAVTHLAIIGSGAYPLGLSLRVLHARGAIGFDVEKGRALMKADPGSIEKFWYGNPYRWWRDVLDLDPLPDFMRLDIPVMVGIGEDDHSAPVESARALDTAFDKAGKTNLWLTVYPGADHRLAGPAGENYRRAFFSALSERLRSD